MDRIDEAAAWAHTAIWPSDRVGFLAWYATNEPDAAGWAAFALYAADGAADALHDRHNCDHCHTNRPPPVTALPAGPAAVSLFEQGAA